MNQTTAFFSRERRSLLLLLAINLFCYVDRYILAAILPNLKEAFLKGDPNANSKAGLLQTAFLVSYMLAAPVFGPMADRISRWKIIAASVAVWSLACGGSGLAATFAAMLCTRVFLGVGEAGYGPAAPTILSDLYPVQRRGIVLAWFYMAIPVGSAIGYAFGGFIASHWSWRWAFYLAAPPGLILAALCLLMRDPREGSGQAAAADAKARGFSDYKKLLKIRSLITNILAQTAMTFAIGGLSCWAPTYIIEARGQSPVNTNLIFGAVVALAGLTSTLFGGWLGDKLRVRFAGAYFLISGCGMLIAFPATIAMLYCPFPAAWALIFIAVFFMFINTGPTNTALANVTPPALRSTAFAFNILVIHLLGDASSPPLIGWIRDRSNWNLSFFAISSAMLLAGVIWLGTTKSFIADSAAAEAEERRLAGAAA